MPLDPNPQSVPVRLPEWGSYRLAMLQNKAYQRVSAVSTDQRAVSRIETYFASEAENWPIASALWAQMMTGCPVAAKPTPEEVQVWTAIAEKTTMPFTFTEAGELKLNP